MTIGPALSSITVHGHDIIVINTVAMQLTAWVGPCKAMAHTEACSLFKGQSKNN